MRLKKRLAVGISRSGASRWRCQQATSESVLILAHASAAHIRRKLVRVGLGLGLGPGLGLTGDLLRPSAARCAEPCPGLRNQGSSHVKPSQVKASQVTSRHVKSQVKPSHVTSRHVTSRHVKSQVEPESV